MMFSGVEGGKPFGVPYENGLALWARLCPVRVVSVSPLLCGRQQVDLTSITNMRSLSSRLCLVGTSFRPCTSFRDMVIALLLAEGISRVPTTDKHASKMLSKGYDVGRCRNARCVVLTPTTTTPPNSERHGMRTSSVSRGRRMRTPDVKAAAVQGGTSRGGAYPAAPVYGWHQRRPLKTPRQVSPSTAIRPVK